MSFLSAEWRKLAIANYLLTPEVLIPFVPKGTELDFWNNKCYVSLVGFMFINTRLLGLKFPFHINFEEVNLRFYVKRIVGDEIRRGVVFIKEIVPLPTLSMVANLIYHEHYQTLPMEHIWEEHESHRIVTYQWKVKNQWQSFSVTADISPQEIQEHSETQFITEHYWGYTLRDAKTTYEYQVTHPTWKHYPVSKFNIDVDFQLTYGSKFAFLNHQSPASVMLAEGSLITVENKTKL